MRLLCAKLISPTALEMRQLKRLLRYVKGTEDMSTIEVRDNNDKREQLVKKLAEGMRLHAHSRGQTSVALSSCEAEVMAASEGIKEALLLQEVLMFAGLGHNEIEVKVDSAAHKRCWTHEAHGFEKLVASRLDCCGRCEIEEDTEKTIFGRHVDADTKCERAGGLSTVDGSQVLQ